MLIWIWVVSLLVSIYLADQKKRSIGGFFFLALLTGPLTVILLLLLPSTGSHSCLPEQSVSSLDEARRQLREVKVSLSLLEKKTGKLEEFIAGLSPAQPAPVISEVQLPSRPDPEPEPELEPGPQFASAALPRPQTDMEMDFARNWLNKIGISALVLGVAFLITYSFAYIGPILKILSGYAVAGVLFFTGFRLEQKDQFRNYGRVLLGGAWGLVYFTTYAMHHFEASRIIASQGIDLLLLALVVSGMMLHVLRHKSQVLVSVVLCVAYLTLGIGEVSGFTVISLLLLAGLVLFFVYRFRWVEILSLGILLTYTAHYLWLMPGLDPAFGSGFLRMAEQSLYPDLVSLVFLSCYWLVFLVGTHLVREVDDQQVKKLAATNLWNAGLYGVLAYPLIMRLFFSQRYVLVGVVGVVYLVCAGMMKKLGREKLYLADLICGVFALTVTAALKFTPVTGMIVWIIEIPFLIFVARTQNERLYRVMGYVLAVAVALRLCFFETPMSFNFLGFWWPWYSFMSIWAGISAGVSFCLTRYLKKEGKAGQLDRLFDHFFSFAACWHFVFALWPLVKQPWIALSLSVQGLVFLALSLGLGLRRFRVYAAALLAVAGTLFVLDSIYIVNPFLRSLVVMVNVLPFFIFYYTVRWTARLRTAELFFWHEAGLALASGLVLLVVAIHQYLPRQWGSLGLGFASVVLLLAGLFSGSKTERMGGMVLLALTLGRVVFVDLSGLDLLFKIITLMALGILFLGVSYVYTRFGCDSGKPLV